ncbi:MAG: lamin tail domain-containing protein [Alphaproteobacteria bacterium]|nr:lamin tail domain-containing protein [Alphaproteobacteria bacterium]
MAVTSLTLALLACTAPEDSAPPAVDSAPTDSAPEAPRPRLLINELMADNGGSLTTSLGATPDWVELYNPGAAPVNLEGWGLSEDPEAPHVFEAGVQVAAGGHLLLYADGGRGQGHLPFRLSSEGETLTLLDPEGWRSDQVAFGAQATDIAAARAADGDEAAGWVYVPGGTPGTSN